MMTCWKNSLAGEAEEGVKSISFTEFLNCYITGSFELMQGAKLHESEFWALRIPKIAGMIKGERGGGKTMTSHCDISLEEARHTSL